jgi:type II secretory pathway component PulF
LVNNLNIKFADMYFDVFVSSWLWNFIMGLLLIGFILILIKVLKRNDIEPQTKTLLVGIMFILPLIGSVIALFFLSKTPLAKN